MLDMMRLQFEMMQTPHWLIVAGSALVIVGALGLLVQRIRAPKTTNRMNRWVFRPTRIMHSIGLIFNDPFQCKRGPHGQACGS